MWHRIAEVLGRTVWETKSTVDLGEFVSWIAYFELKHEYESAAAKGEKPPKPKVVDGSPLPAHVPTKVYKKKRPIPEG